MRCSWRYALSFGLLFVSMFPLSLRSESPVVVSLKPNMHGRLVVSALLNGRGPYDFLVDTGASTTIVDAALFREAGLRSSGTVELATFQGQKAQALAVADSVSVGGLEVSPITVLEVATLDIGPLKVRGVLGENFLSRFDLLIDNQHGKLSLDPGRMLADELEGERLPMTLTDTAPDGTTKARPTVMVKLAAFGAGPMKLLLDSAADVIMLRPLRNRQRGSLPNGSEAKVNVHSVYGPVECDSWEDGLQWGEYRASQVRMASCSGKPAPAALENEGSLPTKDFKRIFVSHSGSYAVVNPQPRAVSAAQRTVKMDEPAVVWLRAEITGTE